MNNLKNEKIEELRIEVSRLEGAARRLLDVLGRPVDAAKDSEPGATVRALAAASSNLERERMKRAEPDW